jgi:hypothetical protein
MLERLEALLADLKGLRKAIRAEKGKTIAKARPRSRAEELATRWLREHARQLGACGQIERERVDKYSAHFRQLLKISAPSNLRASYLRVLDALIKPFRADLLLPLHELPQQAPSLALLSSLFDHLPAREGTFLEEAIGCARNGYLRASAVLGWCAAIDRIHRKVEEIGFPTFNVTSAQMASQRRGRFKRFSQVQNVASLADLRQVFDNVVLWIIEGMGLIDANQHTRLRSCFEMRCQSAHPGDAPITEYNLLSFYSDLKEILFDNPRFQLAGAPTNAVPPGPGGSAVR